VGIRNTRRLKHIFKFKGSSMNRKISINYIVYIRSHYTDTLIQQLIKIKDENKKDIQLNILHSGMLDLQGAPSLLPAPCHRDWEADKVLLEANGIKVNIIPQQNPGAFMEKIRLGIEHSGEYFMRLDEDRFIPHHVWDYIIENVDVLEDDNNLILSPIDSSGIPCTDWFVDQFFNEEDKNTLFDMFKTVKIKPGDPVTPTADHSVANKATVDSDPTEPWDYNLFYQLIGQSDHHYRGIHPIRIDGHIQETMVDMIIKNKDKLMANHEYEMFPIQLKSPTPERPNDRPYHCNGNWVMKTDTYRKIVNDRELFVDKFEEVPFNKYAKLHNLNLIFIKNAFIVHPSYNSAGLTFYRTLSDKFFNAVNIS